MSPPRNYEFIPGSHPMTGAGLPHSETPGSKRACRSPGLIAADRVLHRLVMPRHPSCARIRLAEDRNPRHSRYVATLLDTQTVQLSKIDPPPLGREIPSGRALPRVFCRQLVGVPGIEPGTSSLSGTRSNQLSYTPASGNRPPRPPRGVVEAAGLEPAASSLQSWRSTN